MGQSRRLLLSEENGDEPSPSPKAIDAASAPRASSQVTLTHPSAGMLMTSIGPSAVVGWIRADARVYAQGTLSADRESRCRARSRS